LAQLFHNPGAIHDIGVIDIGDKLFKILCAESHVSLAKNEQFQILLGQCFLKATINTSTIPGVHFCDYNRPGSACNRCRLVAAVVLYDNNFFYQRMLSKIGHSIGDTGFVVISCERNDNMSVRYWC